jgi:hypothetical protein
MNSKISKLVYEIELREGEVFTLPKDISDIVGPGQWTVSIRPSEQAPTRSHEAFLNSYSAEDEGLYDDYSAR